MAVHEEQFGVQCLALPFSEGSQGFVLLLHKKNPVAKGEEKGWITPTASESRIQFSIACF